MGKLCIVSRNHTWNSEFRSFRRYCYTVGYACVAGFGREVMSPSCRPCRDIPGVHCRQCDFDLMASSTDVVGLRDPVLSPAASVLQRGPLTKRAKEVYCNTTSTVMFFSEYTYNLNPHVCVNKEGPSCPFRSIHSASHSAWLSNSAWHSLLRLPEHDRQILEAERRLLVINRVIAFLTNLFQSLRLHKLPGI